MTEKNPLVSVIIPVYNVLPYLGEALDSVVNQSYTNLEIIVIDDGSTDGSGELCDRYSDSRIKTVHQSNQGLSRARNVGLDLMSGDIVAFLDSDDVLCPNMIQTLLEEMEKSEADIAACNYVWGGRRSGFGEGLYSSKEALKELINDRMETAVWNKLYRRSLWDDIRFPEGHVYEGIRTTYKLLEKANRIRLISAPLIYHRRRPGSITQTRSLAYSMDSLLASREFEHYARARTPDVFTVDEVDRYVQRHIRGKAYLWTELRKSDPDAAERLRRETIRQCEGIPRRAYLPSNGFLYDALRYCPAVLRLLAPLYTGMTRLKDRLTECGSRK